MGKSTRTYEERILEKDSRIEKLAQELKHLEAQRKQLQKRQKEEERKIRTHRLIEIGAAVESVLGRCIKLEEIPKLIAFLNKLLCRVYQWCYEYLAQYVHSYVAVGIIALVSVGIAAGVVVLVKIAFDRITEKCDDRWQYYKNTGVAELRKAVSVALCVISVTLSMLSVSLIPVDINVLSWWLILSAGLNFLYHGSCKGSYH